jgi:hypothetical protein
MALTKGDKLIIIGAVVLALTVVAGLAAWRKPHIFFGGKPAPEMTTRDFSVPPPGAAPGADAPKAPAQTPPAATAPPAAPAPQAPTPAAPAQPRPAVHETASLPVPMPGQPVTPAPQDPAAAAPEAPAAKEPPSPEIVSQHPLFAGDQNLDKMFAEMGADAAASKVNTGKKPADKAPAPVPPQAPAPTPADSAPRPVAPEPAAVPAESLDITDSKPALTAKKPVKDKPAAAAKAPAATARGTVVAVSASDKPGEYVLSVTTSAQVGDVTRVYMDDPPRLIIDLAGRWNYTGALSLPGKSPLVRQVRVGKHPDRLRLVLDLAPEAVARLREAPMVDRSPNGVVIRLPK